MIITTPSNFEMISKTKVISKSPSGDLGVIRMKDIEAYNSIHKLNLNNPLDKSTFKETLKL